jgi:hypothetical protein
VRRHTILLVGLLVFLVGIQFRMVESFTLSDFSSRVVSSQIASDKAVTPNVWQATASRKVGLTATMARTRTHVSGCRVDSSKHEATKAWIQQLM